MKRITIIITAISVFVFFLVSCYYDNEEALYPTLPGPCDSTNVTFTGSVVPILQNDCYMCHSNFNAPSNHTIALEDYADVNANAAHIQASIKWTPGHSRMPKNGGKIRQCYINIFDIWVREGMPEN
jgi:hypothetical protein